MSARAVGESEGGVRSKGCAVAHIEGRLSVRREAQMEARRQEADRVGQYGPGAAQARKNGQDHGRAES